MNRQNKARRGWTGLWRWLKWLVVAWLGTKFGGYALMLTGPWGPQIGGKLPNGHELFFQSRPRGRESDDRLIWITPDRTVRQFWVNQIHAGPAHVTVKYIDRGERAWVEAIDKPWGTTPPKVVASLDLMRSDFRGEFDEQHSWAKRSSGNVLDAGRTWRIIWLLGPW